MDLASSLLFFNNAKIIPNGKLITQKWQKNILKTKVLNILMTKYDHKLQKNKRQN